MYSFIKEERFNPCLRRKFLSPFFKDSLAFFLIPKGEKGLFEKVKLIIRNKYLFS